jgi:hypothetical protein
VGHARRHHEGVARPDLEALVADGKAVAPGLDEGRLDVRVAVRQPLAALGEGELHQHDLGGLGQNGPGNTVARIDGSVWINFHEVCPKSGGWRE